MQTQHADMCSWQARCSPAASLLAVAAVAQQRDDFRRRHVAPLLLPLLLGGPPAGPLTRRPLPAAASCLRCTCGWDGGLRLVIGCQVNHLLRCCLLLPLPGAARSSRCRRACCHRSWGPLHRTVARSVDHRLLRLLHLLALLLLWALRARLLAMLAARPPFSLQRLQLRCRSIQGRRAACQLRQGGRLCWLLGARVERG